jgi:hypothetical protein
MMRVLPLVLLAACGSGGGSATMASSVTVPPRAANAGDPLLAVLPAGAELLIEVDLARIVANPVVGAIASEVLAGPPVDGTPLAPTASLDGATAVALASYRTGTPDATTITVVAGGTRPPEGLDLGGDRWALAAEGDVAALLATTAGGESLAGDAALLAVRAWAMPAAADGAALRVTARLPAAARSALAESLSVATAPATVSVWGDVLDDLALVVRLADEPRSRRRPPWLAALSRLRDRAAADATVGALGLARPIADAEIRADDGGVRVAVVISPGRLRRAVARWQARQTPPAHQEPAS